MDKVKPQPVAGALPVPGGIYAGECVKDLRKLLRRNRNASVFHGKDPPLWNEPYTDRHKGFPGRIFHRIPDKVGKHLFHQRLITVHTCLSLTVRAHPQLFLRSQILRLLQISHDQRNTVKALVLEILPSGFQPKRREDLPHHGLQPVCNLKRPRQIFIPIPVDPYFQTHSLQLPFYNSDRGLQLMRYCGKKIQPRLLQSLLLLHVKGKLTVRLPELFQRFRKLYRHLIQASLQHPELILTIACKLPFKLKG